MQSSRQKMLIYFIVTALVLFFVGVFLASSLQSKPSTTPTTGDGKNPIMPFPSTDAPQPIPPTQPSPQTLDTRYPLPTQKRILTEAQRIYIEENTPYIGDEATFTVADTAEYLIYYVGIDDHFSVQLQDIFPIYDHRTRAEQEIATILNVPLGEVCKYDIRFTTNPNVAGTVPDTVLAPCPKAE